MTSEFGEIGTSMDKAPKLKGADEVSHGQE